MNISKNYNIYTCVFGDEKTDSENRPGKRLACKYSMYYKNKFLYIYIYSVSIRVCARKRWKRVQLDTYISAEAIKRTCIDVIHVCPAHCHRSCAVPQLRLGNPSVILYYTHIVRVRWKVVRETSFDRFDCSARE